MVGASASCEVLSGGYMEELRVAVVLLKLRNPLLVMLISLLCWWVPAWHSDVSLVQEQHFHWSIEML